MNSVDITARGLARRAIDRQAVLASPLGAAEIGSSSGGTVQDELVGIRTMRGVTTAADFEARLLASPILAGVAGATHTVETSPFLKADGRTMIGNGATIRNTNPTALGVSDQVQACLMTGISYPGFTDLLTFYSVASFSPDRTQATLTTPGDSAYLPVGKIAVLRGTLKYLFVNPPYTNIYYNLITARSWRRRAVWLRSTARCRASW